MAEVPGGSFSSFPSDSTHFRHWIMSPAELRKRRRDVYEGAVDRLRGRVLATGGAKALAGLKLPPEADVETLVSYFIEQLLYVCEEKHFEYRVTNTAAVYLSRFFLARSALEHDPRTILMTCLLLALKVEEQAANIPLQYLCDGLVTQDAGSERAGSGGVQLSEVVSRELAVLDGLNFELCVLNARPSIQLLTTEYYQAHRRASNSPANSVAHQGTGAVSELASSPNISKSNRQQGGDQDDASNDQNHELARKVSQVNAAAEKAALQVIAHPEAQFVYTPAQIGTACFLHSAAGVLPDSEKFLEKFLGTTVDQRRSLFEEMRSSLHRLRTAILLPLTVDRTTTDTAVPTPVISAERSSLILSTLKQIYRAERLASKPPKTSSRPAKRVRRDKSPGGSNSGGGISQPSAHPPLDTATTSTNSVMLSSSVSSTPVLDQ